MSLSEKTTQVMLKELGSRTPKDRERLAQVSESFDRLVRSGAVVPETYKVQPTSPSAQLNLQPRSFRC